MEYDGGSRDRSPYDAYSGDRGGGYPDNAPARDDGSYDRQDYGQTPYSRSPYEQSPYNGGYYGDYGAGVSRGGDYAREGYGADSFSRDDDTGRRQRGEYGGYGADSYTQSDDTGRQRRSDYGAASYAQGDDTGRRQRVDYGADSYVRGDDTGRQRRSDYGGYGAREGYGEDVRGYGRDDRETYARDSYREINYGDRGDYARGDDSGRGYERGGYARGDYGDYTRNDGHDDDAYATDARRRSVPDDRDGYAEMEPVDENLYDENGETLERAPRKKKKRSKFSRFMRGLGAYIADLPTQSLIIFGGIAAVVLVGVILLVILLPKAEKTAEVPDNGQLSIADITPTPSLPPTEPPPAVTPEPEATPVVDPFNGSFIKTIGEENDVIPAVQERLVDLGYMDMPEGGYTKRYGTATKNGIRIFQIKNYEDSADWDGCLGLGTYTLLMSDDAKAFYLARGDGDSRTADITLLVDAVKKLQARLVTLGYLGAGSDTGVFGSGTATAVKTFQKYHGLLDDGWAGQSTLSLLYSDAAMTEAVGKVNPITPTPEAGTVDAAATADPNAAPATTTADPNAAAATPEVVITTTSTGSPQEN